MEHIPQLLPHHAGVKRPGMGSGNDPADVGGLEWRGMTRGLPAGSWSKHEALTISGYAVNSSPYTRCRRPFWMCRKQVAGLR